MRGDREFYFGKKGVKYEHTSVLHGNILESHKREDGATIITKAAITGVSMDPIVYHDELVDSKPSLWRRLKTKFRRKRVIRGFMPLPVFLFMALTTVFAQEQPDSVITVTQMTTRLQQFWIMSCSDFKALTDTAKIDTVDVEKK